MPSTSWLYRTGIRLGAAVAPAAGIVSPRLSKAIEARLQAGERLLEWARTSRDETRPLLWFHAPSVGEGLQAEAVLRHVRRLRPECQAVYTHFSPSASAFAGHLDVDVADYLPYDFPEIVDRLLTALCPDLLVFAKLDLWPELATRASARGTEVAIIAGTVRGESGRLRWPARSLLAPGYQSVSAAAAISGEDGVRLARLGVAPGRIRVLGDPRFDSVVEKVKAVSPADPLLRLGQSGPAMVAGSTWPADEAVLLQAFALLRRSHAEARLIVVPHEPTEKHLQAFGRRSSDLGLPAPVRLSRAGAEGAQLLVVDRVGVLVTIYGGGAMAYVGGGFSHAGLHSVLEPAAWSVPVAFGPRWNNSRDASLLLEASGAVALPGGGTRKAATTLEKQWGMWLGNDVARRAQGRRAREVVERGLGAAERSAEMLLELISSRYLRKSPTVGRSTPQSGR
jgi:3-deoxy-D-manno-octulosonic-acid transferase